MYKLDLPVDLREAAAIERRKCQEQQRQSRIFNSKSRQIGIDRQGLDQQVKDKKEREDIERKTELAYASDSIRNDKIADLMGRRQKEDSRELSRVLNDFRAFHQQPETRREWDLYDPDARKKDKPARVCDDDPRCGQASLQKFEGEDLNAKARKGHQEDQMRDWHERQTADRKRAEEAEKEANRLYDLKRRELDQRALDLAAAEEACRRAMNMANRHYNEALAREMLEKERLKKQQDDDDTRTAMANALYSDLLTENPAQATSAFGPNRVVPDRFKGMTPEQLAEIRRQQEDQIKDNKRRQMEEDLRNKEWDRQRFAQAKAALVLEKNEEENRKALNRLIADENLRLSKEQKMHLSFMSNEVYTNQPTSAYFMQFNTNSR